MTEMVTVEWAFLEREVLVTPLGDRVAYNWSCSGGPEHAHAIECLWVWHDCTMELDPARRDTPGWGAGWAPTGVKLHTLIQAEPLTIVASVYWPECCGLHGFITEGKWIGA